MKKSRENKKFKKIAFYVFLLIIMIILILILIHYFFASLFSWKGHQSYINSKEIYSIESWMSPNTIFRASQLKETLCGF
ncbi:MAG: hypothetical protein AABW81_00435 [Nanoarchaeota archaeon]